MPKQLLIYESAVPVSFARHGEVCVEATLNYAFSAGINAVPLMAVEFLRAATEYAIVFAKAGDELLPAAVLGVRGDQNLYLAEDAHWRAKYIPAFIRRYPFVFSSSADRKTLTLCVDETHPGVNRTGKGQRLFDDDGKPSTYTGQVLKFLQQYQAHFERTKLFGKRLKESDLLEPMQVEVTTPAGEKVKVGGFMAVSRAKLRALPGDALETLVKTDELELLYLHLYSMRNFGEVKDRLFEVLASSSDTATVAAPPAKAVH
jgi:hypothetical protein